MSTTYLGGVCVSKHRVDPAMGQQIVAQQNVAVARTGCVDGGGDVHAEHDSEHYQAVCGGGKLAVAVNVGCATLVGRGVDDDAGEAGAVGA